MDAESDTCCICHAEVGARRFSKLTQKGCVAINDASVQRKEVGTVHANPGNLVHVECRKTYTKMYLP